MRKLAPGDKSAPERDSIGAREEVEWRQKREVRAFSEVALRGYGELVIEQAPDGKEEVTIEADASLMTRIAADVTGRRLVLGLGMPWYEWITWWFTWMFLADRHIRYTSRCATSRKWCCRARVPSRATGCAEAHAACDQRIGKDRRRRLAEGTVETRISDRETSPVRVSRRRSKHGYRIWPDPCRRLECKRAVTRISGSGDISVHATETLDVGISGSGRVSYAGEPRVDTHISGSGRVPKAVGCRHKAVRLVRVGAPLEMMETPTPRVGPATSSCACGQRHMPLGRPLSRGHVAGEAAAHDAGPRGRRRR